VSSVSTALAWPRRDWTVFNTLPVTDQQTCIVMAQRVKPGPGSGPRMVPGILGVAEPITVPTW